MEDRKSLEELEREVIDIEFAEVVVMEGVPRRAWVVIGRDIVIEFEGEGT